jgi:LmbE family N-acetylglucosaminyl deacetylase
VLDLQEVALLDYMDGGLDQADAAEVIARLVAQIRRLKPRLAIWS